MSSAEGDPGCTLQKHRAVQILRPVPQKNNIFEVDAAELVRIFGHPPVANTPVAIYSIAGAFRGGKSFMLNFFLRYLWAAKNNKSDSWLDSKEDELIEGFAWRGGGERHTQGIWIWDEPFFIDTQQTKVALFLLDSQGSFDHHDSVKGCSFVFAFSTLMSSLQIYNVSKQVQGDHLQHLQLFTQYAKSAYWMDHLKKQINQTKKVLQAPMQTIFGSNKTDKNKPQNITTSFQHLMFLIRDWGDTDYECDFDGGVKYLQKILTTPSEQPEVESVRKGLRDAFENISCFLIKQPGEKVAERGKMQGSQLQLKDVRNEFIATLDILVKRIFSRKQVIIKKVNGNPVTGTDLINLSLSYFKALNNGKMPDVKGIAQAQAENIALHAISECSNSYKQQMNKFCDNQCHNQIAFKEKHESLKAEVLKNFDGKRHLGDPEFLAKYRKSLVKNMDLEFVVFKKINEINLNTIINDAVREAKEKYKVEMQKVVNEQCVEETQFAEIEKRCRQKSIQSFKNLTKDLPYGLDIKPDRQLEDLLTKLCQRFQKENTINIEKLKQKLETEAQTSIETYRSIMDDEKIIREFEDKMTKCYRKYQQGIRNEVQTYMPEPSLHEIHLKIKSGVMLEYEELYREDLEKNYKSIHEKLEKNINDYYEDIKNDNSELKDSLKKKNEVQLERQISNYLASMKDLCDGNYVDPSFLKEQHKTLREETKIKFFGKLTGDLAFMKDEFETRYYKEVDEFYEKVKEYNEHNRNIFVRVLKSAVIGLVKGAVEGAAVSGTWIKRGYCAVEGAVSGLFEGVRDEINYENQSWGNSVERKKADH